MTGLDLPATLVQLAWYIERDGARLTFRDGDGIVTVPLGSEGYATYRVPAFDLAALDAERDRVYKVLAEKRRAEAAR